MEKRNKVKLVVINNEALKNVCAQKISEAEERYNYVKSVIPEALDATRTDINEAHALLRKEKYIMCLYGAAKAKAEADVLLSLMGVEEKRFNEVIDLKLNIALQALMKAQKKNVFPIIAYSYYEYAKSLKDFDRVSSLLFTEYALELSNIDIYFEETKPPKQKSPKIVLPPGVIWFVIGSLFGGLLIWIISNQMSRRSFKNIIKRTPKKRTSKKNIKTLQASNKRRLRGKKR